MERVNKKSVSLAVGIFLAVIFAGGTVLILESPWNDVRNEMSRSQGLIADSHKLLIEKQAVEAEWAIKKNYLNEGVSSDEVLNAWLRELLAYAQTQSLQMDKIEPAGLRAGAHGKESMVFLSFQCDIKMLTGFIYHLLETDPMARIETFSVRKEEGSKQLAVELMLGKVIA
jgi:hypothetical protein